MKRKTFYVGMPARPHDGGECVKRDLVPLARPRNVFDGRGMLRRHEAGITIIWRISGRADEEDARLIRPRIREDECLEGESDERITRYGVESRRSFRLGIPCRDGNVARQHVCYLFERAV